jgi:phosphoglycerate dehydrogenase-like enzyme
VESVRSGGWQVGIGRSLAGATVGIVGLGRLGARVAHLLGPFEAELLAWSPNITEERAEGAGVRSVAMEKLLRKSDFVTIHLTLSERSRGLIGGRELALMKPSATLINTSRGPIVDQQALITTMQSGGIAAAALDVFDDEPLAQDSPLRSMKNVIATPHIGYVTRQSYEVFYRETVEDVLAFLNGTPLRVLGAAA